MTRDEILANIERIKESKKFYANELMTYTKDNTWRQECVRQCHYAQVEITAWQFALNFCED